MSSERRALLIFAQDATLSDGGEAARPLHYFRALRERGVDVHLLVHERNREHLEEIIREERSRLHFVPETWLDCLCAWVGDRLPERIYTVTLAQLSWLNTQGRARRMLKRLIPELGVGVLHQPTPISPRSPSRMYGLNVPVVIGPLNGAMDYPPAFHRRQTGIAATIVGFARMMARPLGRVFPGLRQARVVLVSNERTRKALPSGLQGQVMQLVANAVHTNRWVPQQRDRDDDRVRFVFSGRLVNFKATDLLIEAFAQLSESLPTELEIIGEGSQRTRLEELARSLGVQERVHFSGWAEDDELIRRKGQGDVFVFPSLREAGGAVLMEAMSLGIPVIAADWGGPSAYVRPETGILVGVESREQLVSELTEAMQRLAEDPELRERLGQQGRRHALAELDWNRRIDDLMALYQEIVPGLAVRDSDRASPGPVLSLPSPASNPEQDSDTA